VGGARRLRSLPRDQRLGDDGADGHPQPRPRAGPPRLPGAGAGPRRTRLRLGGRDAAGERLMAPYALREAAAAFRRTPLLGMISILAIGLSLFVVGLFTLTAFNIRVAIEEIESRVEVVAYLVDGTPAEEVRRA